MFDWDAQKDHLNADPIIERCTSDMLFQPDYEQNLAVVDSLNAKPKLIATYFNAIKRRMSNPSEEIVLTLCVNLLETILKNVPGAVEIWGKREYQEYVVNVVVTTKHLRAREALLELVQALGRAYENDSGLLYGTAYVELRTRHKISFPPPSTQEFVAPTARTVTKSPSKGSGGADVQDLHRSSTRKNPEFIDPFDPTSMYALGEIEGNYETVRSAPKSSKSKAKKASIEDQLDTIGSSMGLLNDVLDNLGPGDKVSENELIQSILPTVERLHQTIITTLQNDPDSLGETLLVRLFSANDAISETLNKYERAKKGIFSNKPKKAPSPAPAPKAPPKPTVPEKSEDDSFDEFAALATRKRPGSGSTVTLASPTLFAPSAATTLNPSPFDNPFTTLSSQHPNPAYFNGILPPLEPQQVSTQVPLVPLQPTHTAALTPTIVQPTYTPPFSGSNSLI